MDFKVEWNHQRTISGPNYTNLWISLLEYEHCWHEKFCSSFPHYAGCNPSLVDFYVWDWHVGRASIFWILAVDAPISFMNGVYFWSSAFLSFVNKHTLLNNHSMFCSRSLECLSILFSFPSLLSKVQVIWGEDKRKKTHVKDMTNNSRLN